jgi:hypothetical protein
MTTDKTCPRCGNPGCMPPHDYFVELANECYNELDARNQIPPPYTLETICRLERNLIADAKTIFCRFHDIDSQESKNIKAPSFKTLLAIGGERYIFLDQAADYIRWQLLQAYGAPAPNETA